MAPTLKMLVGPCQPPSKIVAAVPKGWSGEIERAKNLSLVGMLSFFISKQIKVRRSGRSRLKILPCPKYRGVTYCHGAELQWIICKVKAVHTWKYVRC